MPPKARYHRNGNAANRTGRQQAQAFSRSNAAAPLCLSQGPPPGPASPCKRRGPRGRGAGAPPGAYRGAGLPGTSALGPDRGGILWPRRAVRVKSRQGSLCRPDAAPRRAPRRLPQRGDAQGETGLRGPFPAAGHAGSAFGQPLGPPGPGVSGRARLSSGYKRPGRPCGAPAEGWAGGRRWGRAVR